MDFGFGPPKKGKDIFGGLGNLGFGNQKPEPTKRRTLYSADKDKILNRQKGKCAGKNCSKRHRKKLPVTIRNNFDHIRPLALGGKDIPSNIQALCANCHQEKTREDRKKIAEARKEGKKPSGDGMFEINLFGKPPKNNFY